MDSSLFSNSRATSLSPMSSSQSLVHWFWLARKRGWHFRISTSHFWHPPSLFRYILSVNCLEFGSKPRTTSWPYTSSYCNFQRWLSQAFADWLWAENPVRSIPQKWTGSFKSHLRSSFRPISADHLGFVSGYSSFFLSIWTCWSSLPGFHKNLEWPAATIIHGFPKNWSHGAVSETRPEQD